MTEEEKQKAAAMKLDFDANLVKHADKILELEKLFHQHVVGGASMSKLIASGSVADTYAQARIMFLADTYRRKHPGVSTEALELYAEGYCEGLAIGVFLSELGLASLITREK